jgi:alpha-glucosidase (family GH31 glycosyl hydrolase)
MKVQRKAYLFLAIAVLCVVAVAQANDPVADAKAVIVSGDARFTVLTPQLLRMEWSADGKFEDHASLVFINRKLPVPKYSVTESEGWLEIKTEKTALRYQKGSGRFAESNLAVSFPLNGKTVTWHPGMVDKGNLLGTARTLDGVKGSDTKLEPGLISRDGWVLVDDSARPLFDNSEWPWGMQRPAGDHQDFYLFAYGHDYKQALYDFTRVAGKIPVPPRFAFGTWWSRYWAYTDQELKQLVNQFEEHDVPLDVLVVDMDWHQTFNLRWGTSPKDQSGHTLGWTGYTWDKTLFPDPPEFLSWVHAHGLKTTLNLHPASGVQPHEEQYPVMARAMGIDPATKKYVPFDITNKKFAENYFKILHHPLEKQGVDFWWLDWQQEPNTKIPGVNPTWWLNYTHFTDMEREGKRPLLFHRWGGLGNHRYQIGFSGDTISVWESLAFQPYFTATAANVGYGYWSHDIGGHMPGVVSPELFTRWIQFGVFSPILRTHTTKNPDAERRIWAYPEPYAEIMRDAYLLRYALIPYIYTSAREAYDTGVSICRPMYYGWPEVPEAYETKDQYQFGDDLIVAPVATEMSKVSDLATKTVWLPEGTWYEWSTGALLKGPAQVSRTFALDELPVYVRAGAILPMQPKMRHAGERPVDPLILAIYPGVSGSTRIYDDAGNTLGYKTGEFTWTKVRHSDTDSTTKKIIIEPVEGRFPGMLERRSYEIRLVGDWPAQSVTVNGKPLPESAIRYDGNRLTSILRTPEFSVHGRVELVVRRSGSDHVLLNAVQGKIARLTESMQVLNGAWPKDWSPESLIRAVQTGDRISLRPQSALQELQQLQKDWPLIQADIEAMKADAALKERAMQHLEELCPVGNDP